MRPWPSVCQRPAQNAKLIVPASGNSDRSRRFRASFHLSKRRGASTTPTHTASYGFGDVLTLTALGGSSRTTSRPPSEVTREPWKTTFNQPLIERHLTDERARNAQLSPIDLVRQSVYSRLAGYEEVNDAERLSQDPAFRIVGSHRIGARRGVDLALAIAQAALNCLFEAKKRLTFNRILTQLPEYWDGGLVQRVPGRQFDAQSPAFNARRFP
jgi:hypothetical protein